MRDLLRLAIGNLGRRLEEWSERSWLAGDTFVERFRLRWQAAQQPKVTER